MGAVILALNAGSSSLKFGAFAIDGDCVARVAGGSAAGDAGPDMLFDDIAAGLSGETPAAIGHRIVHGGPALFDPVVIDDAVMAQLKAACAFAPLHGAMALGLIAAATCRYPGVPQVACVDTGFHRHLPPIAAVLPIPGALRAEGLRRYGFHGLSCQSIVRQLGSDLPGRLVIAHLGSGASVTAVLNGRSIDTSMGLTPAGGVVMGTRTGDIDPGLLLFLLRERGMTAAMLEDLVDRQGGLLGISGCSADLRVLRGMADTVPDARLAIAIFCRSVARQIAAMIVSLGGVDLIVFSGGIGEHDAGTRRAICADLAWAGVAADVDVPAAVPIRLLPPREQEQIARNVSTLIFRPHRGGSPRAGVGSSPHPDG